MKCRPSPHNKRIEPTAPAVMPLAYASVLPGPKGPPPAAGLPPSPFWPCSQLNAMLYGRGIGFQAKSMACGDYPSIDMKARQEIGQYDRNTCKLLFGRQNMHSRTRVARTWVRVFAVAWFLFPSKSVGVDASFFHLGLSYGEAKWRSKESPSGISLFLGGEYHHIQILGDIGILQENWPIRNEGSSEDPIRPSNRDALIATSVRVRYGRHLKWGFWPYAGVGAGYGNLSEEEKEKNLFLLPIIEIGINNKLLRYINFGVSYRNDRIVIQRFAIEVGIRIGISQ